MISGCSFDYKEPGDTRVITDSIGREVEIPKQIDRVAVLNAYTVELINAIDKMDTIVGVDYRIYQDQEGFKNRFTKDMIIGQSQGEINLEKLIELNPQVLIVTGGNQVKHLERKLKPFGISVVVINSYYTNEFEKTMDILGTMYDSKEKSDEVKYFFLDKLKYIETQLSEKPKKRVYFEYRKAGQTTVKGDYFYYMLSYSGADNVYENAIGRQIDVEDVVEKNPDYIIKVSSPDVLSSYTPPTINEYQGILNELSSRPGWDAISAIKNHRILLISHYGHGGAAKLVGTMYIAKFLYPEYLEDLHPEDIFYEWVTKYQKLNYQKGHTYPEFLISQ